MRIAKTITGFGDDNFDMENLIVKKSGMVCIRSSNDIWYRGIMFSETFCQIIFFGESKEVQHGFFETKDWRLHVIIFKMHVQFIVKNVELKIINT